MEKIKVKKLNEKATIPEFKTAGAVGMDLTSVSKTIVNEKNYGYIEYDTGLAFEIPEGYGGFLFPRSSVSETGLIMANSVGVIDSDYRGAVKARFKFIPGSNDYKEGERCCQIVFLKVEKPTIEVVEELSDTARGGGGFGHTGT